MLGVKPSLLLVAIAWTIGTSSASAAAIHTETATSGAWHATFTYVEKPGRVIDPYADLRLMVTHHGRWLSTRRSYQPLAARPWSPGDQTDICPSLSAISAAQTLRP
jgi:hypothetical protein